MRGALVAVVLLLGLPGDVSAAAES